MIWGKLAGFYLFKLKKKILQVHNTHESRAKLIKTSRQMENTKTKGKRKTKHKKKTLRAAAENIFWSLIISEYSPSSPTLSELTGATHKVDFFFPQLK